MKIIRTKGQSAAVNQIAAITYFYNYAGFRSLAQNYRRFAAAWRAGTQIPLYTIECLLPGQQASLPAGADTLPVAVQDPFIHKESAINHAVREWLPAHYQTVIWTDCDYLFSDYGEFARLPSLLARYRAVQCMARLDYLDRQDQPYETKFAFAGPQTGGRIAKSEQRPRRGFHGGCWAADRALWNHGGLYSGSALGGHDTVALMGMYGPRSFGEWTSRRHPEFRQEIKDWATRIHPYFAGQIGCLEQGARHLYHGQLARRQYVEKHQLVRHLPPSAFQRDVQGFLQFNRRWFRNHALTERRFGNTRAALLNYYRSRNEDE